MKLVVDPHHLDADPYQDLIYHFDADPDPDLHLTYHFDADPDPDLYLMRIRIRVWLVTLLRMWIRIPILTVSTDHRWALADQSQ